MLEKILNNCHESDGMVKGECSNTEILHKDTWHSGDAPAGTNQVKSFPETCSQIL